MLTVCSYCGVEMSPADPAGDPDEISHGICLWCLEREFPEGDKRPPRKYVLDVRHLRGRKEGVK